MLKPYYTGFIDVSPCMCPQMLYDIYFYSESLIILIILIWFPPSVCSPMCYMTTLYWESLVTLFAFVWSLLYVYAQTFYETTINCNTFVTMHLLVRFIPSVCYKMCFKILLCKKVLSHWLYRHISRHLYWMFLYFYLYNVLHRTQ